MAVKVDLVRVLRVRPHLPAPELRAALAVSPATLSRLVRAAGPEVLTIGRARRTSYAALRELPGSHQPLPVFRIGEDGSYGQMANLTLAHPHGSVVEWLAECPWPLDADMRDGWFGGLPYFLQDLRPEGFLGRAFARHHGPHLGLGEDPTRWSEEEALLAVSRFATDPVGDLIIGNPAMEKHLHQLTQPPVPTLCSEVTSAQAYPLLADKAMAQGQPASSAAGEFPKFPAILQDQDEFMRVLVKFSGSDDSPGSRRWADLLVCEHLALRVLSEVLGIEAARTRILESAGRTFLEAVRFDRHGAAGRSAVCSWGAIRNAWLARGGDRWPEGVAQLSALKLIEPDTGRAVSVLWNFGQLIANTDMHDANLSFRPHRIGSRPGFRLAPAYDMLPMRYAPQRGVELPEVEFRAQLPLPAERDAWRHAAEAAVQFWDRAAHDDRISRPFRQVCAVNCDRVRHSISLA